MGVILKLRIVSVIEAIQLLVEYIRVVYGVCERWRRALMRDKDCTARLVDKRALRCTVTPPTCYEWRIVYLPQGVHVATLGCRHDEKPWTHYMRTVTVLTSRLAGVDCEAADCNILVEYSSSSRCDAIPSINNWLTSPHSPGNDDDSASTGHFPRLITTDISALDNYSSYSHSPCLSAGRTTFSRVRRWHVWTLSWLFTARAVTHMAWRFTEIV